MAVCEQCGVQFDPSALPKEMSSARLLCLPCYERRQAEKAAKAAKAGRPVAAGAATTASLPRPPAAARPPDTVRSPPPDVVRPPISGRPPGAARPADIGHRSEAVRSPDLPRPPAAAKPPAPPAPHAPPAPSALAGAKTEIVAVPPPAPATPPPPAKHASSRASRHGPGPKKDEHEEKRKALTADAQPMMDRTTRIGMIFAGVLLLGAGGAWLFRDSVQKKEADEVARVAKERSDFLTRLKALDPTKLAEAISAATMIRENQKFWKNTDAETEVQSLYAKHQAFIDGEEDKKTFVDRLMALEAEVAVSRTKTAAEIADLRRRAEGLKLRAPDFGADVVGRVSSASSTLQGLYVTKLVEEGKTYADSNPNDGRGALAKLATAEDEVRKLIDVAMKSKDKTSETTFTAYYQELITRADSLALEFYTPEEVAKNYPWRDLLVGDAASEWRAGSSKGFQYKVENGVLQIKGPDEDAKAKAVLSIGFKQQWRDFVMDAEFTIEAIGCQLAFRLGNTPDIKTDIFDALVEDNGAFQDGGQYGFTYTVIGSQRVIQWQNDTSPKQEDIFDWSKNRHGEFGIIVPKGSKLKFTKIRIRELR